ncbi:MAG: molybdopterin-dependent oxidoreductase [Candidatus Limnocylindrales bacterium]
MQPAIAVPSPAPRTTDAPLAALSGAVGAGLALGLSELVAGLIGGATSLVAAIGQAVIDRQPTGAKDLVVALFGTNDKLALEVLVVVVAAAIGAGLGVVARRSFLAAGLGFAAFGVLGFLAAVGIPAANPSIVAVQAALSVGAGIQVLSWSMDRLGRLMPAPPALSAPSFASRTATDPVRRSFLMRTGALGVTAVVTGLAGRWLLERGRVAPDTGATPIPPAGQPVAPIAAGQDLAGATPGLTPLVVPNETFYRIDTALLTPSVDIATWTLRVHGLVDREVTFSWADLITLPLVEQYVTIACVSNEVGGDLVGNAKWTGVRLRDVLELAGVQGNATQLVGRSVDGWTAGMPMAWVMDEAREPLIAVKMNDEPLPPAHGYPARLIVPGLYGYVSATKWLKELEVTTWEAFDGYWVPLGWSKEGPILTQSRIDTPRGSTAAGRVAIAGVGWAPDRGIGKVEVAIDGAWREAQLSTPISDATWVQWVVSWDATPGDHVLQVRATDGEGVVQEELSSPPAPDGARGWHTVRVRVG